MKPIKITRQTLANGAQHRWASQYISTTEKAKIDILAQLKALGDFPDPDAVDKIIGNRSWTSVPRCDCCMLKKDIVIRIGEEPDYESATAIVCEACLKEALALL